MVIGAARKLGGKVGARWALARRIRGHGVRHLGLRRPPGADQLAGLVYIDGGSAPRPPQRPDGDQTLQALDAPARSPWLAFGGITAPYAGLFEATGAACGALGPELALAGADVGLLPADIVPPVPGHQSGPVRLRAQRVDVAAQPARRPGAPRHGHRRPGPGPRVGRDRGADPDQPIRHHVLWRGIQNADGTEWYFPQRLTDDTAAVATGTPIRPRPCSTSRPRWVTTSRRPSDLRLRRTTGWAVRPRATQILAQQSGIPMSQPHSRTTRPPTLTTTLPAPTPTTPSSTV